MPIKADSTVPRDLEANVFPWWRVTVWTVYTLAHGGPLCVLILQEGMGAGKCARILNVTTKYTFVQKKFSNGCAFGAVLQMF